MDGAPTLAGNTWPGEARVTDSSREATEVAIRAVRIESRTNFAVRLYDEYVLRRGPPGICRAILAVGADRFGLRLLLMLVADAFKGVQDQVGHFGLNALVQVCALRVM